MSAVNPDGPVRCILAGMGGVTREMLKSLAGFPWFVPAAVVDPRPEAREQACRDLGLPERAAFPDLAAAVAAVPADAAIINTPSE
ncbi:MAG: gfo/Idh/MocA family oxidoreductase, partial [Chloroflexota bacterium]